VAYNTDVPYAGWVGVGSVLYGVGDIRVAHTADEAIAVADMERGVGVYADLVEELLGMVTAAADQ